MNKLFKSMGIAIMALLFIALLPVTILIGAVVALFIIITIDVYHQQGN